MPTEETRRPYKQPEGIAQHTLKQSKKLFREAVAVQDPVLFMIQGMTGGDEKDSVLWGASAAAVLHLNDRINLLVKQVEALQTLVGDKI